MSVDSRLQYLWKSQLGDAKPPPQQEDGTVYQQQSPQRGSNSGQDISAATIGIPIRPQGPQPPRHKKKTRDKGRDCRDRWRLGAEIATAIIGVIGLGALIVTLDQSRRATEAALQSVAIARKQMELSERPWITVDASLTDRVEFGDNGGYMVAWVSLKNIGHSVATGILVDLDVVLLSHVEATPGESSYEPERRRNALCERIRGKTNPRGGGTVLFPEQQVTSGEPIGVAPWDVEKRAFESPGEVGKFIDPILVGCVSYRDVFTSESHVTGFVYMMFPLPSGRWFHVGEKVLAKNVQLKPDPFVSAYID